MIKNRNIAPDAAIELSKVLGAGVLGAGRIVYVAPATSNSFAYWSSRVNEADLFNTVEEANNAISTNRNDIVVLSPDTHSITSMLSLAKNRTNWVGDFSGRRYGPSAKIVMGVTTAVTDVHAVKNTGVRNSFTGIKFDSGNTLTEATSVVGEGGEYATYNNCEFYSGVKLDSDTYAEVLLNGDSTQFNSCTFGSLAAVVSGNKVRPAVITTLGGVAGGAGTSRDVLFDDCRFWKKAGGTTTAFVKVLADAEIERVMEFHDCQFVANILGATPAVAIASATSLTVGQILLTGDTSGFDVTKLATATGIISCLNAKVATATIGLQTT